MIDKAGKRYWDRLWTDLPNTEMFNPRPHGGKHLRDREFAKLFALALHGQPAGSVVLEAGAADSPLLPYFAQLGYQIVGVDYSQTGCDRLRQRLGSTPAHIICADIFDPPPTIRNRADLVLSVGLVEHFTDTAKCLAALAALVRPGGALLTIIPNMYGATGAIQRLLAPTVYNVHVRLSPDNLREAHKKAGLPVDYADFLLATHFGIVNGQEPGIGRLRRWTNRVTIAGLSRMSQLANCLDERVYRLPRTSTFSPYCYALAHVPK